jgi:hypothetical protein
MNIEAVKFLRTLILVVRLHGNHIPVKSLDRNKNHPHRPNASLSCFQKRIFYAGIKIFNSLPGSPKTLMNQKVEFKVALRKHLSTHCFYSVGEFFCVKMLYNTVL